MTATAEIGHELWELSAEAVTAWAALVAVVFAGVTAVIAGYAAKIALRQMREARESGEKADAQESFRSYLDICVNNPDLASPNYVDIKKTPLKLEQYIWFVAYFLAASEKIIGVAKDQVEWEDTIKLHIKYHRGLIADRTHFDDEQLGCYSTSLRRLIWKVTDRRLSKDKFAEGVA